MDESDDAFSKGRQSTIKVFLVTDSGKFVEPKGILLTVLYHARPPAAWWTFHFLEVHEQRPWSLEEHQHWSWEGCELVAYWANRADKS